ncbi:BofC C-terminal domain-containing protein [Lederbergia wuyishanensis]|uniref:Forespore regulator of the sigma-K checkpoint n=1 Tax=Lederbergia wuyishanensis TaxID=1347903 RepID=A0ABU0D1S6_9BACI|nr:intercompartmental signaling factor BofC [Lederbergia wuyishanensis]MCJ8006955.1 intercompartmental signaling factor BofC [Lederbergia wuyishanensis]MDQ0342339.1 forespore regulator of the sigma-K checkpoint [Lederbergia wuyishanensis]
MKFIAMLLMICLMFIGGNSPNQNTWGYTVETEDGSNAENRINNKFGNEDPLLLNVVLKRKYLDGEISEETVQETIWALEDFWAKYEAWQLVDMDEDKLVFETIVDDISPLLKLNGFFGITEDGTLTIFNGSPEQADIIQSFFQIDIKKLEGKKHLQLKQGIPVKTKEIYTEVLETMKQYSLEKQKEKKPN